MGRMQLDRMFRLKQTPSQERRGTPVSEVKMWRAATSARRHDRTGGVSPDMPPGRLPFQRDSARVQIEHARKNHPIAQKSLATGLVSTQAARRSRGIDIAAQIAQST